MYNGFIEVGKGAIAILVLLLYGSLFLVTSLAIITYNRFDDLYRIIAKDAYAKNRLKKRTYK